VGDGATADRISQIYRMEESREVKVSGKVAFEMKSWRDDQPSGEGLVGLLLRFIHLFFLHALLIKAIAIKDKGC